MPNPFSINIITPDGAALIAQATAANQIVFTAALSGTTAATDAADLASKTAAFYDGITGTINACSATDNIAKIVAAFGNAGASSQAVKSVCILGRLASQSAGSEVIVAAMSDDASTIVLPPDSSPSQKIRFPFNFAVTDGGTIETVYADGATIADLERFVSMHKAGDPTQGDDQTIKGDKTFYDYCYFNDEVIFQKSIMVNSDGSVFSGFEAVGDVKIGSDAENPANLTVYGACNLYGAVDVTSGDLTVRGNTPKIHVYNTVKQPYIDITNTSITMTDASSQTSVTIYAGGNATFGGKLTVNGDIKADNSNQIAEFYNCDVEGMLSVRALDGLAPSVSNGVLNVPIGGLVFIWSSELITISNNIEVGDVIEIPANTCYSCKWSGLGGGTVGAFVKGSLYIPAGGYVAIMGSYMADGGSNAPILFVRIEL